MNFTELVPLKPAPLIVTTVPEAPLAGVKLEMAGLVISKVPALVPIPPGVVTSIFPVVAPAGTEVVICVDELRVNVALVPLKLTSVAPRKFVPVRTTLLPALPLVGVKLVIDGGVLISMVKSPTLEPVPPRFVTEIIPVVAAFGTTAVI